MIHQRQSPIEMSREEFKEIGYRLIDIASEFIGTIRERQVTPGETHEQVDKLLVNDHLPETGTTPSVLMTRASDLLINHSLLNGHPKFFGYITSSAAPIGALGDLLAAVVNPNVGAFILSPVATEIEKQTIRWLAEFIGLADSYGGILVSGGNMANFTGFLAGRMAKAPANFKEEGISNEKGRMIVYCSGQTHTWIDKAATLFGHGSNSIRWIRTDNKLRMDIGALKEAIGKDLKKGNRPFMVVGTAGDVSTGAVDDLVAISDLCKAYDLWFHIDGAYGIPAAGLPEMRQLFAGADEADSIALDPHKWFYAPLEVGCTLVKDPRHLLEAFSSHPAYYNFDTGDEELSRNFYEYGLQNSRGFRALKVWLALQQVGKRGYTEMIAEDIKLSKLMFELANKHPELEAQTQSLSIATFRYVPRDCGRDTDSEKSYLNTLNEELLNTLQQGGELFLSNAIVDGSYFLRACIVNFRTSEKDIEEIIGIIAREGAKVHLKLKENMTLKSSQA